MKKLLIPFIVLILVGCTTTKYVDRPYYVSDSTKVVIRDTVVNFITSRDTVTITAKGKVIKPVQINTDYLCARAWLDIDSLYLTAKIKPQKASIEVKYVDRIITNTPASTIETKTVIQYVKVNDRLWETTIYYCGWFFIAMVVGACGFGVFKILIKLKVV